VPPSPSAPPATVGAVAAHLDALLRVAEVRDAPGAMNGLQFGDTRRAVTRVAGAVDLCRASIRLAAAAGADLLLVHHGLFWGDPQPLVGPAHARVTALIESGMAVYSAHLPLDVHPEVGNAPLLARALGVTVRGPFGEWQGQACGVWGDLARDRRAVSEEFSRVLGGPTRTLEFGPGRAERVGIVTGSGGSMLAQAAALGLDTLVTGEVGHHDYFVAEELGLNVLFGGHYATETFGVRALAEHVGVTFKMPWSFVDHPTGL